MFTHVVFFKLVEPKQEKLKYIKNIFLSMEDNIPQLKNVEVGIDKLRTDRSFDICLITKFQCQKDYEEYAVSDYHVNEVLAKIKSMISMSKVVDYEL